MLQTQELLQAQHYTFSCLTSSNVVLWYRFVSELRRERQGQTNGPFTSGCKTLTETHTCRRICAHLRMSGGKASGNQAVQYTGKQAGEGSVVASRVTCVPAANGARGKGKTEADKVLAATAFVAALDAVPAEDWCRTWAAGRTIMLRCTSKKVQEVVDKMRLSAVVRLSRSFWDDTRNGTADEKLQFVMTQLEVLTTRCRITTLALPECEMNAQDAERLAGVLEQCPALARLDLRGDSHDNFPSCLGAEGAQSLGRVLRLCPALTYLNLSYNRIGTVGRERLRASWRGPGSGLFL